MPALTFFSVATGFIVDQELVEQWFIFEVMVSGGVYYEII